MGWRRMRSGSQPADFRGIVSLIRLPMESPASPAALAAHGPARGKRRMRAFATFTLLSLLPSICLAANKLTFEDRIELTRGLTAEYAKVKLLLPRSRKPLEFDANGTFDKKKWDDVTKESGPAARTGDLIQITKIDIEDDKLVLEINGGMKGKGKWHDHVQIGLGNRHA